MLEHRKIKIGKRYVEAILIKLQSKNFILLKGSRGYVMCGYLNLKAAEKFKDVAVKVSGVSSIKEALSASVHSCTSPAGKLGIYKGQPVKDALEVIA